MPDINELMDISKATHGFIAIDPGEETGIVFGYHNTDESTSMWMPVSVVGTSAEQIIAINDLMSKMHRLDEVIVEGFELSSRTLKAGTSGKFTAELFYGFKVFLDIGEALGDEGITLRRYTYRPVDIKTSITDEYMKLREYWIPGNKQYRDAMRLFLYHARVHSDIYGDLAK